MKVICSACSVICSCYRLQSYSPGSLLNTTISKMEKAKGQDMLLDAMRQPPRTAHLLLLVIRGMEDYQGRIQRRRCSMPCYRPQASVEGALPDLPPWHCLSENRGAFATKISFLLQVGVKCGNSIPTWRFLPMLARSRNEHR